MKFGGNWTDDKLDALRNYLRAYTTALKKSGFNLLYVDAFAGAGQHRIENGPTGFEEVPLLGQDDDVLDEENYRHGEPLPGSWTVLGDF